jgi:hypothetical protein
LASLFQDSGVPANVNSNIFSLDLNTAVNSSIVQKAARARKKSNTQSKTKKAKIADLAYALGTKYARGLSTEILGASK